MTGPPISASARVRDLWSFQGRYRILHLTWFAFLLSFVVWFDFAPFATTVEDRPGAGCCPRCSAAEGGPSRLCARASWRASC